MNIRDITGKRFGRLTAVRFDHREVRTDGRGYRYYWLYLCDCGNYIVLERSNVGHRANSCGCLAIEVHHEYPKTHGLGEDPLYRVWTGMKTRCYNKNERSYKNYGQRGITICPEWLEDFQVFYDWAMGNGYQKGLSIDRINVNKGYSPENCRFATNKEQCRNKTSNINITYNGETKCLAAWCEDLGIKDYYSLVRQRIRRDNKSFEWAIKDLIKD